MSSEQHHRALSRALTEKLRNGQVVTIRPLTPEDIELEREFITELSPESRHFRFLGGVGKPSQKLLEQLTDIDHYRREGFIAITEENGRPRQVGASHYALDNDGGAAECSVVVADAWQTQGLGTLLIDRLIESARARGLRRLYSIDSAENFKLREVAQHLGWTLRTDPDDHTQVLFELELNNT